MDSWPYNQNGNESVISKVQRKYWVTKQTVFRKLGKKEDEWIVASDAELDAKLELFKSVQETSHNLLTIICRYQSYLTSLAEEEEEMGFFMKMHGKLDKTRAGKMMVAVGTSIGYIGQQRFSLQPPLERLYQKLETFYRRGIADTHQNIKRMEEARTEYRAALNWMKDVSQELDPDTYNKMERFKMVQEHVKACKERFDALKVVCATKIDVLCASRSNMFSNLLMAYEKSSREFAEKCVNTLAVIANSFKGYQQNDFCVVRELSDLKPGSTILVHDNTTESEKLLDFEDICPMKIKEEKEENLLNFETSEGNAANEGDLCDLAFGAEEASPFSNFLPSQLLTKPDLPKESELKPVAKEAASSPSPHPVKGKSAWLDLFAELDPLSNPDTMDKVMKGQHHNC